MATLAKLLGIRSDVLDIKSFSVTRDILGQGAFGVVFKGKDAKKNPIAAKRIDGSEHSKVLTHHYDRILHLDHQNIIKILDIEKLDSIFWMFMEFCEIGDLNKFYRTREVSLKISKGIMIQIMSAIAYLYDQYIIHRDIKPGNLLLAS